MYKSARSAKGRPRDQQLHESHILYSSQAPQPQYVPYATFVHKRPPVDWDTAAFQQHSRQHSTEITKVEVTALAPLDYLQNIPPPRRHPLDEKALMSFTTVIL
jgi:hypothetical protein